MYYDPWMAGVVLPSLVVVGLMAIPYIDFNKQGNGYYTIEERKFAYMIFQLGFLELWVTLIVLGTLLRGPNWNFFGPFEDWDPHKVQALNNVNLSEYFWAAWLGHAACRRRRRAARLLTQLGYIICARVAWHLAGAGLLHRAAADDGDHGVPQVFHQKMGFIRYMVLANLLLFMMALPIKMVLRWSFNLKYLIAFLSTS